MRDFTDPMEKLVAEALQASGVEFLAEDHPENRAGLDFYLPQFDVYIEVKRMASDRSADQLRRSDDIILVQGKGAVELLAGWLKSAS